jgi:hypothetical protein
MAEHWRRAVNQNPSGKLLASDKRPLDWYVHWNGGKGDLFIDADGDMAFDCASIASGAFEVTPGTEYLITIEHHSRGGVGVGLAAEIYEHDGALLDAGKRWIGFHSNGGDNDSKQFLDRNIGLGAFYVHNARSRRPDIYAERHGKTRERVVFYDFFSTDRLKIKRAQIINKSDVTANNQVVVIRPPDQEFKRDTDGTFSANTFPRTSRFPRSRGRGHVRTAAGTSYAITTSAGMVGQATVDNTPGSATKGAVTSPEAAQACRPHRDGRRQNAAGRADHSHEKRCDRPASSDRGTRAAAAERAARPGTSPVILT